MIRLAVAALLVGLVVPGVASAHATLRKASPVQQSRIDAAPRTIELTFDQEIGLTGDSVRVYAEDGEEIPTRESLTGDGRVLRAALPALGRGGYTVRWRELSSDGHVGVGAFTFGYGVAAPPATEAVGASGLTWKDDVVRWVYFTALALLLGALAVRLVIVGPRVSPRLRSRLHLVSAVAVFAVLDAGVIAFVVRGSNVLQVPFEELMYGDLSPLAQSTRYGTAFAVTTVGFAVVAGLLIAAWTLDHDVLLWPAFALAAVLAAGLSFSGHQATEPNASWASQLADWVHILAASLWVGGLVVLAVVVWGTAPELRASAFLRFSRLAVALIATVVLAGTYLAIVRLPQASDLWETTYGRTLLLKMGIVLIALAWGGVHHRVVRPRLERGETPRGVGRSLLGESTVAVTVLIVAALLVNASPPTIVP